MTHPSIHALTQPDKIAYRMAGTGKSITYRELDRRSNQAAHLLRQLGLRPRDHIALLMENCIELLVVCWAAQRSGLFYTTISTHLTPREINHIVDDCNAKVFITSPELLEAASEAVQPLPTNVVRMILGGAQCGFNSWDAWMAAQPITSIADETVGYDMLYSSGTTGLPKGITPTVKDEPIGTLSPLLSVLCREMCEIGAESIYLSPAPLYHAAPLRFSMMTVALGGTVIIMEKFDPELFLSLIESNRVTHTQVVPTMFVRLLRLPIDVRRSYDVTSLRVAVHAAAPCPVEVKAKMIDWWGPILLEYYASTEACGLTVASCQDWIDCPGTVGRAMVGKLRILDEEWEELPAGEIGSIYFSDGPKFTYYNDPEKTRNAYSQQGWATSGDVGFIDADGYLYLTDRKAYMIISGGVNIYPQEAENVLLNHPQVYDAAVFGVPDVEMGESVKAVVQLIPDTAASSAMAEALIAFCREHLSAIKCPRSVDFIDQLPRTPTGKLIKRELRDPYWNNADSI
jgi:long-chain acyl-CoA synthetase